MFTMRLFIIPLALVIATQVVKLLLEVSRGTFTWSHVNSYGGMPSAHAAFASSLATTLAYYRGFSDPAFAVSVVLLVVILRDAMGFRYQLGKHGAILNKLIKELPDRKEYAYPILSERLGHTPSEVAVGLLVGVIGSLILCVIWGA